MSLNNKTIEIPDLFYEGSLGFLAASIDELDLFEHDGLIEKIPWGKLAIYVIDSAAKIKNLDNAFNDAFSVSYYFCFRYSILFFKIHLKYTDLKKIKKESKIQKTTFKFNKISFKDLKINEDLMNSYSEFYSGIMEASNVSFDLQTKVFNRINSLINIFFFDLIENYPKRYKIINKALAKTKFNFLQDELEIEKYYKHIKSEFEEPLLFENEGLSLKDLYIPQSFKIIKKCFQFYEIALSERQQYYSIFEYKELFQKVLTGFSKEDKELSHSNKNVLERMKSFFDKNLEHFNLDYYLEEVNYELPHNKFNWYLEKKLSEGFYSRQLFIKDKDKITNFIEAFDEEDNNKNTFFLNSNKKALIVLGYPGQGKSTFCKKYIYDYINKCKYLSKPLFFVKLKNIRDTIEFTEKPLLSIEKHLKTYLPPKYVDSNFENSIFILDGLDEIAIRSNISLDIIDETINDLFRAMNLKDNGQRLIVTSRYGYLDLNKLNSNECTIIQISDFSKADQLNWLQNYNRYKLDSKFTDNMLLECQTYSHLNELLCQPIMLHMIATTGYELTPNSDRSEIYNNLFTAVINRAYEKNRIFNIKQLSKEVLRMFLQEIAFFIFNDDKEYISKKEVLKLNAANKFISTIGRKNLSDSIKGLLIASYFRETKEKHDDEYSIEFIHKSLYEYLASEKVYHELKQIIIKNDLSQQEKYFNIIKLFSNFSITIEVFNFLKEFIKKEKREDYELLIQHLTDSLNYFLSNDNAVLNENNYFIICLGILSISGLKKDILSKHSKRKIEKILQGIFYKPSVVPISFNNQDLSSLNLSGLNFIGCSFVNSNFTNSIIERSVFDSCDLSYSKLIKTNMNFIHLNNTKLNNCLIKEVQCKDSLINKSSINNVIITNSSFFRSSFKESVIFNSKIDSSYFFESNLSHCNLENSNINNCNMRYSDLTFSNYDTIYNDSNLIEWVIVHKRLYHELLRLNKEIEKMGIILK